MLRRVQMPSLAGGGSSPLLARTAAAMSAVTMLAGCGSAAKRASAEGPPKSCEATVLDTLGRVLRRIYGEGIFSERTASARHMIEAAAPLRHALETGSPTAVEAAALELVATGHMTNLRVMRGTHTLAKVGGPALTPLGGTIKDARGKTIGSYLTSVWSDAGFIAEGSGVTEGLVALRSGTTRIAGSLPLPSGPLASEGTLTIRGAPYQYTSFPGKAYPKGAISVFLLRPVSSTTALCGSSGLDTTANTLEKIANLIYAGEGGHRTLAQIRRVQRDQPLLQAVAHRDPVAARTAVEALLHKHLVRLRVLASDGSLLVDDGGPFVLAPVTAPLRLEGRKIGSIVLSVQDDEGYKRLLGRLVGLKALMYMNTTHPKLVKNSLGTNPGKVPASGNYTYRGSDFRVFTVHAKAFPSGPLTVRVLIPIPYR
jgi:hypothetical protein